MKSKTSPPMRAKCRIAAAVNAEPEKLKRLIVPFPPLLQVIVTSA
jgi:hypothetical protein